MWEVSMNNPINDQKVDWLSDNFHGGYEMWIDAPAIHDEVTALRARVTELEQTVKIRQRFIDVAEKRVTQLEAQLASAREALEDEVGIYRNIHPSCQAPQMARCQCNKCREQRSRAALDDSRTPEAPKPVATEPYCTHAGTLGAADCVHCKPAPEESNA